MRFFHGSPILALTSDASIDFTPQDFGLPLTAAQQHYLKQQTGVDIPQVYWRKQVHEADVIFAQGHAAQCSMQPDADAFVTNQIQLPIAIRTADCVPVFLYDPVHRAIGLAHAGWKGTYRHITVKTLQTMQDKFGTRCYDVLAVLGPAIRSCCYQVGEEFKSYFPMDTVTQNGALYVDIAAANRRQLLEYGLAPANINDSGICTCCSSQYFSFRRDGAKAGRMISLMMLL